MRPSLAEGGYNVALLGEALGADEAEAGSPFVGKAGFKLTRLIGYAGLEREKFDIYNSVWCRPPDNRLEGTDFEQASVRHCKDHHWAALLHRAKVIVPLGNVATAALLGKKGILSIRGYVHAGEGYHILPTVHPSFIQRGQSRWSAPFINDLQKAVHLARNGMPAEFTDYRLDPSPMDALTWARVYLQHLSKNPETYLAFDIETPGKGEDEEDVDTDSDAPDRTWNIERIGFSYAPLSALSIPWAPEYMAAIRLVLGSAGPKVVWNAGFDVPRVRRAGVSIAGTIHDGMVAWHILHSDLPKKLGFVATFTCPWQPAWKHLSGSKPAFYNATDADVEFRSMVAIERELRGSGLWEVYQRDVLDLEPILVHMSSKGMPVDGQVREDRAVKLAEKLGQARRRLEECVPIEARRIEHVYKNTPKCVEGLLLRPATRTVPVCPGCGLERPRKDHFKTYVKKKNPCAGKVPVETEVSVDEYYRLSEFSPSRDQLVRYHHWFRRPLPQVWDKKANRRRVSFAEGEIKKLILRYPDDIIYPTILEYRSLDKIAGTYIGRPVDD